MGFNELDSSRRDLWRVYLTQTIAAGKILFLSSHFPCSKEKTQEAQNSTKPKLVCCHSLKHSKISQNLQQQKEEISSLLCRCFTAILTLDLAGSVNNKVVKMQNALQSTGINLQKELRLLLWCSPTQEITKPWKLGSLGH